ncbi:GNAT family N-acetyltransferase [Salipaludibacillus agaradhaerens]|jgi:riboflavin biosynthesis RibT protein|uniref:GNAT family N-acetyltransferase n=1 Tax=Salipaludibacillus agaradhaerens TaxID=76935 RepID=UPI000998622F|nr:GNAT family N-acetyltransferase [Salipaludibacillus agaradhaerens]
MLIPYKKEYEKIAMGLLSFMPGEKRVQDIQKTLDTYRSSTEWKLYLWKHKDGSIIGVAGIEEANEHIYLHDITLNPSYRNEGVAKQMVDELEHLYKTPLKGTKVTEHFLEHCRKNGC